jgi:sulfur-oxidizing protein SoxZ
MAQSSIKIRAKVKNGEATVKCLISHPMETGLRKDKKNR